MNRRNFWIFLIALFIIQGFTIPADNTPFKVACIGDSITFGARTENPAQQSYPAVLGQFLKNKNMAVKNFGISSATILQSGTPNVWKMLDSLNAYKPDAVIIMAGTNDTVGEPRFNWEHIDEFEGDYVAYIHRLRSINPDCIIILCSPPDMLLDTPGLSEERYANLKERRPRIWELRKRIKVIARKNEAYFLDMAKAFRGKTDLITPEDGVHPNASGYQYMAEKVFDFMEKHELGM